MHLTDFDYEYPPELIAQEPLGERDASRLLVMDRATGRCEHRQMHDLPALLSPGDLLVLNDTRVLPMRLRGTTDSGRAIELLLLEDLHDPLCARWRALAKGMKRLRMGQNLRFSPTFVATIVAREDDTVIVAFDMPSAEFRRQLDQCGEPPLPPYITRAVQPEDRARYQTVFANHDGSAAAPTAGLHFSEALLTACRARGIDTAHVTLHVGLDTFQPIRVENLSHHHMHGEYFSVPETTRAAIATTKQRGGRVIAVGTTSVRALESMAELDRPDGITQLFITPGFRFQIVDALLTNFHQPRTTLLALVSAFTGREHILAAYREAIANRYRLFSYGDAMLLM